MKDLFSGHAADYAKYRPAYPPDFYQWLLQQVAATDAAWDCGTGNGQVAAVLSNYFTQVFATDISEQQMAQAPQLPNIIYTKAPAEESGLEDASVDLVAVAQAVHWFQFNDFYKEVKRVLRPGGLIVIMGYGLLETDAATDVLIQYFYSRILAGYWDAERRYLDERYQTIPFPFTEIKAPSFTIYAQWTANELTGYLNTWSAVKHYQKAHGINPVNVLHKEILQHWRSNEVKTVSFPVLLRIGKV